MISVLAAMRATSIANLCSSIFPEGRRVCSLAANFSRCCSTCKGASFSISRTISSARRIRSAISWQIFSPSASRIFRCSPKAAWQPLSINPHKESGIASSVLSTTTPGNVARRVISTSPSKCRVFFSSSRLSRYASARERSGARDDLFSDSQFTVTSTLPRTM